MEVWCRSLLSLYLTRLLLRTKHPSKTSPSTQCSSHRASLPHNGSSSIAGKMANFAMDPFPYTSPSMFLEDGDPLRQARRKVFISGGSSKAHEDCAIAVCNDPLTTQRRHDLMHDISQYVVQEVHQQVRLFALHPHGVGIFKLKNASQRDVLIALNPHMVGPREITFHPHDEAPLNFRKTVFFSQVLDCAPWLPAGFKGNFYSHPSLLRLLRSCIGILMMVACLEFCLRFLLRIILRFLGVWSLKWEGNLMAWTGLGPSRSISSTQPCCLQNLLLRKTRRPTMEIPIRFMIQWYLGNLTS
jgi:hypothetical protein